MIKPVRCFLILLVASLTLTPPGKSFAAHQNRTDLSGTWAIDLSLSDYGLLGKKDLPYDEWIFIITQQEPEIKITRKTIKKNREWVAELIYYTDGRGEKNPIIMGKETIKSKTAWEGDKLVSRSVGRLSDNANFYRYDVTDSWELSPDGETLIYTTSRTPPKDMGGYGPGNLYLVPVIKRVFKRVA